VKTRTSSAFSPALGPWTISQAGPLRACYSNGGAELSQTWRGISCDLHRSTVS
jgi:hypothetical protein